jgi:hypothetical protein
MSFFKNMGGTIGYIIGAIVILPLLLSVYNFLFINKNDAKPAVRIYAKNSVEIKVTIPHFRPVGFKLTPENLDKYQLYEYKRITTGLATKNMGRSASTNTKMEYRTIYIKSYKKYFSILMFDMYHEGVPRLADAFWGIIDSKTLFLTINKDDLVNPKYGSKENPVPVFKVRGADRPLTKVWDSSKPAIQYDVSEDQYRYNVLVYLTFVMPKKEFNARFKPD